MNRDIIRIFRTNCAIKKVIKTVVVHFIVVKWNVLVGWGIVFVKPTSNVVTYHTLVVPYVKEIAMNVSIVPNAK